MIDFNKILNKQQRKAIVDAMLTPLSWLYGAGVATRNFAFRAGILKQQEYEVPVVSVGNITVGGTGKTPHVEYLIEHLCQYYHIGVLSRGYKRETSGFILASSSLSASDIGDEPYQIYHKFAGMVTLAVCEDRRKGIREMLKVDPEINLFLLDDAFQHRYVKPKVNIVLIDYSRQPADDHLMPLGTLREPAHRLYDSNIVVITKCPPNINRLDVRMAREKVERYVAAEHRIFFSNIKYAMPRPVFPMRNPQLNDLSQLSPDDLILGLTGIANHRSFVKYLRSYKTHIKVIHYSDHHKYTRDDFKYIFKVFAELEGRHKFIVTTEKDAVRILNNPYFPPTMRQCIYYVPIKVGFLQDDSTLDFISEVKRQIDA